MLQRKKVAAVLRRVRSRLSSAVNEPRVRRRLAQTSAPPAISPFAVYFADAPQGAYQLKQWLPALNRLAATGTPVTLLLANADTAARLLDSAQLPVALCPQASAVEDFVVDHRVQVLFYVNNNQANFTTLRINGPYHVHLSHGESEKSSMVSNQLKAYDAAFIAGPASRERILHHVRRIDPSHLVEIGRPQLDLVRAEAPATPDIPVILYAPTWEGDGPAMAYSSLREPGLELIRALNRDPRVRLVFRPHPKTGTYSADFTRALHQAHQLLGPSSESSGDAVSAISLADVVVTDVSAMAMDSVGLGKPTVVLASTGPQDSNPTRRLTSYVTIWPVLPSDAVDRILEFARRGPDPLQREFRDIVFGPAELGTGTERFIRASHDLLKSAPN
jgi:Putative glycosyl/glycerophosphate transferases involved in teichoic acid biosynthesis TagF/TagB/EpsJ/RodC